MTIDQVIDRLSAIVAESQRTGSRAGYFAALYNRVTLRVRDGIRQGEFEDSARMERLDVLFASRYLEAYDRFHAGELPSRSWLLAFECCDSADLTVLQHLLLGMNAHIHLDLAVAAARTCPGTAILALKRDFDRINDVLAALVPTVDRELDRVSPVFRGLSGITAFIEPRAVDFSMAEARNDAWKFALVLARLPLPKQVSVIAMRDLQTLAIGEVLRQRGPILRWMQSREQRDVAANIAALASGEMIAPPLPQR